MCDPVSMFVVSAAVTGAGAVQQAGAARAAGRANQQYYNFVSEQNKQAADAAITVGNDQANQAQLKGAMDSAKYARSASEFRGVQRATSAAMGVGAGSATAEDIGYDTMSKEQLDQQAIRYNADLQSWSAKTGAKYQAWDYRNQSSLNSMAGVNARRAGNAQATASLISGATSIASSGLNLALLR